MNGVVFSRRYVAQLNGQSLLRYIDPLLGKEKLGSLFDSAFSAWFFFPSSVVKRAAKLDQLGK